jgi:hypothetical protein
MGKNWFGLNSGGKNQKLLKRSRKPSGVKAPEVKDRFSNVVVVEWGGSRDNGFSTFRRYLRSWKKRLKFGDKEKKQ